MTERKWTPGKWTEFHWGKNAGVTSDHQDTDVAICSGLDGRRSYQEEMANARLIAAAPDLYEALEALLNGESMASVTAAQAALAKARG